MAPPGPSRNDDRSAAQRLARVDLAQQLALAGWIAFECWRSALLDVVTASALVLVPLAALALAAVTRSRASGDADVPLAGATLAAALVLRAAPWIGLTLALPAPAVVRLPVAAMLIVQVAAAWLVCPGRPNAAARAGAAIAAAIFLRCATVAPDAAAGLLVLLAAVVLLQWLATRVVGQLVADQWRRLETQRQFTERMRHQLGAHVKVETDAVRLAGERARFIAAASHDLRQPVHAIGLFVAALMAEPLPENARALVERLNRSLSGLDEMFHRLLDISRLDAGAVQAAPREFALEPIARALETRFSELARSRGLRFTVHCAPGLAIRSDPALLAEILMNLISNAFRYTERGGVLLGFRVAGDRVRIQVIDTGRGIPPADQQRIFEEFVQLDNPAKDRRKGVGLGLAIVRRLAQALEHPLTLRSRPGAGSTFELRAPRVASLPVPRGDAGGDEVLARLSGALVLVVDDEIDVLAAMDALLGAWDCFTLLARSVEEAVASVHDSPRFPDVIVTDYELADGQTGADVVEAVHSIAGDALPVIVLSGSDGVVARERAAARGWDWLIKPAAPQTLAARLAHALGHDPDGSSDPSLHR